MVDEQSGATGAPKPQPPVRLLVIVRRGETERFELLRQELADEAVRVVWDRRGGERRGGAAVPEDRRQSERRGRPPATWSTLDFTIVREPGG
jgi:hypothetical protein